MSVLFFTWFPLFIILTRVFLKKSGFMSAKKAEATLYLFLGIYFISIFFAKKNNIVLFNALTPASYEMFLFIGLQALLFCFFFLMLNLLFVFYKVVKNKV
jgi:hypothetical protein